MRTSSVSGLRQSLMAALLVAVLVPEAQADQQRGLVTVITVSPSTARVGTPVTAGVTGKNPCGAVHIDWGDGTALTYAIVDLTTSHTHTYEKAGNYTVVARGMGNCDGEASAKLRIDPAPTPPNRPQLTAFTVSIPAPVGASVGVTAHGTGTCRFLVEFGDGKSQEYTVPLPHTVRHVYSAPGSYTVSANATMPCEGRHEVRLNVRNAEPTTRDRPQLTAFTVSIPGPVGASVGVTAHGTGTCRFLVEFGDGKSQEYTVPLPHTVRHVYSAPGSYTVSANATMPCEGRHEVRLNVRNAEPTTPTPGLTRLVIAPNPASVRTRITITIHGSGTCPVTVDFGDGTDQTIEAALPARIGHTYARPGRFEVFAWAEAPCGGDATAFAQVRERRYR